MSGELLNSSSAAFELALSRERFALSRERFETATEKVVNTNAVKTPSQLLVLTADLILAATGLRTDARLAKSCGIAFNNGYCVNPERMITNASSVYALGDCASFGGHTQRFIEPILRQAQTIAHDILGLESRPFKLRAVPVRLKSRSMTLTLLTLSII